MKRLTELVQEVCSESSDSIMQMANNLYFKLSDELATQKWGEEICGDTYNELWDDAVFELQSKVSDQIANNIDKLFSNLAYLEKNR